MAKRYRLVCFDEFHVADITDAMILHRLLEALFANGVGFVTTSNFKPDDLYPNGLHRDRILPAIDLLNRAAGSHQRGQRDRLPRRTMEQVKLYHTPLGPRSGCRNDRGVSTSWPSPTTKTRCCTLSRARFVRGAAKQAVWCGLTFKTLCGGPRSQNDYLEIASQFHTVLLSDVPAMSLRMASEARRFTWLVDVLYDRRVKLIMSAAVTPEALYTEARWPMSFPGPCRA
jgi:cell division protein ZapE